jgi:hypothetical protein
VLSHPCDREACYCEHGSQRIEVAEFGLEALTTHEMERAD